MELVMWVTYFTHKHGGEGQPPNQTPHNPIHIMGS